MLRWERGRRIAERQPRLRIMDDWFDLKADVYLLDGLSAHADRDEILRWLKGFAKPPRQTWVVHGEPESSEALASAIRERLGWEALVAQDGQRVPLE